MNVVDVSAKLAAELEELRHHRLDRECKTVKAVSGPHIQIDSRWLINFCSNDYLGLAQDPEVREAAAQAIREFGVGSSSAPLLSGYSSLHQRLEIELAQFKGYEAALLFPAGFSANVGVLPAIANETSTIVLDRLCHASLIDGARLSKAKFQVYPHKDIKELQKILEKSNRFSERWIVTDSIFSMDGDLAPLPEILELARHFDAQVLLDDAHGTGVMGQSGRGLEEHFGILGRTDLITGTFSKALGSLGGFVVGKKRWIDYLRNRARTFIFSTASPPSLVAAALQSLRIIQRDPSRVQVLNERSKRVRENLRRDGLSIGQSESPIIPIMVGDVPQTIEASQKLFDDGIFLAAIRPPTVPKNEARLRVSITLLHDEATLDQLVQQLAHPTQQGLNK